jgi:tetratricopeptide (TPR) repeat protein
MNPQQPVPEPDPRASLESLEKQLRALPPPPVPTHLPSKLIAAIAPVPAAAGTAASIWKLWPWMAAIGAAGVVAAALTYTWLANRNPRPAPPARGEGGAGNSTNLLTSPTSKAIRDYEEAIRIDPYNADAWFALAKAQAAADRPGEAASSAQKALDVARSRDRTDLVPTIEAWLRSRRKAGGDR